MNIIYLHPNGYVNPHLFPTYKETFSEQGHIEVSNPYEATHCFIEMVSGEISYNQEILRVVKERRIPLICFDNREFHVMGTGRWYPVSLEPDLYFIRTMIKGDLYPDNCFPYDWAYFNEYPQASKEELSSRPYDVCFIGVEAPARTSLINGLLNDGRLKVKHIFNDHLTRLPHSQWINEHRQAKLFIECEGGGLASEKFLQLFSIAAMLKVDNKHLMAFPFTQLENCIKINEQPSYVDIEIVCRVLKEPDWLYGIYTKGIIHMKEYYSESSVSNYILKTINQYAERKS